MTASSTVSRSRSSQTAEGIELSLNLARGRARAGRHAVARRRAPDARGTTLLQRCDAALVVAHVFAVHRGVAAVHEGGVVARPAVDRVALAAAEGVHRVVAVAAEHAVAAGVGAQLVVARAAVEDVGAAAAGDAVVALVALEVVGRVVPEDRVVAGPRDARGRRRSSRARGRPRSRRRRRSPGRVSSPEPPSSVSFRSVPPSASAALPPIACLP